MISKSSSILCLMSHLKLEQNIIINQHKMVMEIITLTDLQKNESLETE